MGSWMPLCWPQAQPLGASQNIAGRQGWPCPWDQNLLPLPDILFLSLILILKLFNLTFKQEDQTLGLSLPQEPGV